MNVYNVVGIEMKIIYIGNVISTSNDLIQTDPKYICSTYLVENTDRHGTSVSYIDLNVLLLKPLANHVHSKLKDQYVLLLTMGVM